MVENLSKINKLFDDLYNVIKIGDINFHRFVDGSLSPIHIMETELMGAERWKQTHRELKVKITGDPVLERILKGETVYIYDVPNDPKSSPAFASFGIKSLVVYPLFKDVANKDEAIGLICIPALDKKTEIKQEIIEECGKIVKDFNATYDKI